MKTKGMISLAAGVAVAVVAAFGLGGLVSADIPPAPAIGTQVPDFTMKDYNGAEHSLAKHKGEVVVLAFTSQECPYSRAGEPVLAKTAAEYKDKGVTVLSIDSHKGTTAEQIKEYATSKNDTGKELPYPVLKDVGNTFADAMGAKQTPEIYIVDKEGKLAYHGALDNQTKSDAPDHENYVKAALDSVLDGKPVDPAVRKAYGCGIKRAS